MSNERLEALLIWAFEWAIECGETTTHDLIRGTGITSDELEIIGYDKDNFPKMHECANDN